MFEQLLKRPAVMVQGITGRHGAFHTRGMLAAGTRVVCGVTPGKGGAAVEGLPVYNSVQEAKAKHGATVSVVFVPAQHAKNALIEAIIAGIELIVCITEHIPVHDMIEVLERAKAARVTILGPNCPGLLIPGVIKLGIIPAAVGRPGSVAVVSRSGTLTYEAASALSTAGAGQRYVVGIGGDRVHGAGFTDMLAIFEADPQVDRVMLIGEIGGADEQLAAAYIRDHMSKPVFAYIVGQSATRGTQLGHAGAILTNEGESAEAKVLALQAAGVQTARSLPELVKKSLA